MPPTQNFQAQLSSTQALYFSDDPKQMQDMLAATTAATTEWNVTRRKTGLGTEGKRQKKTLSFVHTREHTENHPGDKKSPKCHHSHMPHTTASPSRPFQPQKTDFKNGEANAPYTFSWQHCPGTKLEHAMRPERNDKPLPQKAEKTRPAQATGTAHFAHDSTRHGHTRHDSSTHSSPRTEKDALVFLPRQRFAEFLALLQTAGCEVIGPVLDTAGETIVYGPVHSPDDLPIGCKEEQRAGYYRIEQSGDDRFFAYATGPDSVKKLFFPPSARREKATTGPEGLEFTRLEEETAPLAILGARGCDLAAANTLDRVFLGGCAVADDYEKNRDSALVIAVNCTHPASTCFCTAMGTGPEVQAGYDLALTELDEGFIAKAGNEQGRALCATLNLQEATAAQKQRAHEALAMARSTIETSIAEKTGGPLDFAAAGSTLISHPHHPRWAATADRCLSCTNCTMVCPTCFCHRNTQVSDLSHAPAETERVWDSCFTLAFAQVAGHNFRPRVQDRYRQWLTHKFSTWHTQFGVTGCVGCGRCITWCPVGIDVREEVAAIGGSPGIETETTPHTGKKPVSVQVGPTRHTEKNSTQEHTEQVASTPLSGRIPDTHTSSPSAAMPTTAALSRSSPAEMLSPHLPPRGILDMPRTEVLAVLTERQAPYPRGIGADYAVPLPATITKSLRETADTVTLTLACSPDMAQAHPGQFVMVTLPGLGAPPFSISRFDKTSAEEPRIELTVRSAGKATEAFCALSPGHQVGLQGPYGKSWPVEKAAGHDLLLLSGGLGLAPLRPVLDLVRAEPHMCENFWLLDGARSPENMLFTTELAELHKTRPDITISRTVDETAPGWEGPVGRVTQLLEEVPLDSNRTLVFVCGPEAMMTAGVQTLASRGVSLDKMYVSIERHMECGVGLCGHCQLGPYLACTDGPVFSAAQMQGVLGEEGI